MLKRIDAKPLEAREQRREQYSRYALIRLLLPLRRLFMLLGERWVERGWLERAEEICFFTSDELARLVALPKPVLRIAHAGRSDLRFKVGAGDSEP